MWKTRETNESSWVWKILTIFNFNGKILKKLRTKGWVEIKYFAIFLGFKLNLQNYIIFVALNGKTVLTFNFSCNIFPQVRDRHKIKFLIQK